MKTKSFNRLLVLLGVITMCVTQMWGADRVYTAITSTTSLDTGDSVIIAIQDGATKTKWWAMEEYTSNNLQGTNSVVTVTSNSITNPVNSLTWYVTKQTNGTFTFKSPKGYYIYSSGDNTTCSTTGKTSSNWYITNINGIYFKLQVTGSTGRVMCANNTTPTKMAVYVTSSTFVDQVTNNAAVCQYARQISIFKKSVAQSCTNTVTISKGSASLPDGCSFSLSKTEGCGDGDGDEVTVDVTTAGCYVFDHIEATNGSVNNSTKTVSGIKANTTISVVFTLAASDTYVDNMHSTVMDGNYCGTYSAPSIADKSKPAVGNTDCAATHYHFMGWVTEANKENPTDVNIITANTSQTASGATYYAVWAVGTGGSGSYKLITDLGDLASGDAYIGSYINYSGTRYYAATSVTAMKNVSVSGTPKALSSTAGLMKVNLVATATANQYYIKDTDGNYLYCNSAGSHSFSSKECAWTFSGIDANGLCDVLASTGTYYMRAYASSTSAASLKTYASKTNAGICIFQSDVTYSNYATSCGPVYTVTAATNNAELGTVSGTTTITASPNACVGYDSPAYVVTGGTATVNQVGNTFSVSNMSADVTVTIQFVETSSDTYVDDVQSTDMSGTYCGSYSAPVIADKAVATSGTCEEVHYHFVGWTTSEYRNSPAGHITTAGTTMTGSGTTYYAVWAREQ